MSKTKAIANNISENSNTQKLIFHILISGILLIAIVYVYMIGSITFNVLARKSLETSTKNLGNEVSWLELTYLGKVNEIDKNYALAHGFVDTKDNLFATRSITHVAMR